MTIREFVPAAHRQMVAFVLLVAPLALWAGPPFRTDDPEAVEYQHSEDYVFYQQTLSADGRSGVLPALEYNHGVYKNVQLHVVLPVAFAAPSGLSTSRGYGDTELGVKWQLNEETDTVPMLGVFPLIEIATGRSSKGLGSGYTQLFIPLWAQKKWGDLQTYGGGGYWINNGGNENRNYWFFGWQAQYQVNEHLTFGAEVFHATEQRVGQGASSGFNIGGSYNVDEHNHLLFSAGKGVQNAVQTNRASSYVGYQITF